MSHRHAQYEGTGGAVPERRRVLCKSETNRKRLAIPMFRSKVKELAKEKILI